jgi:hypothetical protein
MKPTEATVRKNVGIMIANSGPTRRKGLVDYWSGVMQIEGNLYSVSAAWHDDQSEHEADVSFRAIKSTSRHIHFPEDMPL